LYNGFVNKLFKKITKEYYNIIIVYVVILLLCDYIKDPEIPLDEVLELYPEKSSLDPWKQFPKFPDKSITVEA